MRRSLVRAIGLKNMNVLQPTNVEILSANSPSWPVSLNYNGFVHKMIRRWADSPTIKTFPPKERFLWNIVNIIYERRFTIWKACKCEVTAKKYISNQKRVSSWMAFKLICFIHVIYRLLHVKSLISFLLTSF